MTSHLQNNQNYVGILFEIENQDENTISLHFDVFVGSRIEISNYSKENITKYQTGLFKLDFTHEQFFEFFNLNIERSQILVYNWFELKGNNLKNDGSVEAYFYNFNFTIEDQPQNMFFNRVDITIIGKRKKEDREFLNTMSSLVSLDDLYDKKKTQSVIEELNSLTKSINDKSEINVVSFNVGQGNATGIFDKSFNPILYFDLGGGAYWNKHTYPIAKIFPTKENPMIILSHWDFDHYESIKANVGNYAHCKIIAPLQKTTPSIRKFAALVSSNIYLIDKELGRGKNFSFLKLFKCNGKKENDTGLGLLLDLKKDENISEILLPGDSQYFFIKQKKDVDAICVSHHGGKLYTKKGFPVPNEKCNGYCVYSYGKENTYKHPKPDTVQEHINKGWGIDRFLRKYSLSTTTYNVIYSTDINISALFNESKLNTLGPFNSFHGLAYNRDARIREILSLVENN